MFNHLTISPFICNAWFLFSLYLSYDIASFLSNRTSAAATLTFPHYDSLPFSTSSPTLLTPHISAHPITALLIKQLPILLHIIFLTLSHCITLSDNHLILHYYFLFIELTFRTLFVFPTRVLVFTNLIPTLGFPSIRKWSDIPPLSPLKTLTFNNHPITFLHTTTLSSIIVLSTTHALLCLTYTYLPISLFLNKVFLTIICLSLSTHGRIILSLFSFHPRYTIFISPQVHHFHFTPGTPCLPTIPR